VRCAFFGGLSILLGYRAKLGAWLIDSLSGSRSHSDDAQVLGTVADPMMQQMQMIMFMKNVSMLGGALLISQLGSGPWSLDARGK
jgi:putative oxidoreductase